jgi:hypothetical protein
MAAVLACGQRAVLSHLSAAVLWKTWRRRVPIIHVLSPHQRTREAIEVHRARRLDPRDVTTRDGIPTTTPARTLVDLTDLLTSHQLANAIHEAAFRGLFDEPATRAAMDRANGRRRLDRLATALELNAAGSAGTKSGNEDRFLELVDYANLPAPRVNTRIRDVEADYYWPALRLCVEIDGDGHARPRTRREDARRDRALAALGIRTVRLSGDDVDGLLEAARRDLAPRGLALLEPFDPELALHARRALELDVLVGDDLEVVAPRIEEVEPAGRQHLEALAEHGRAHGFQIVHHEAEVA